MRAIFKIVASSVLAIFIITVSSHNDEYTISWIDVPPAVANPVHYTPVQTSNLPKLLSEKDVKQLTCLTDNIYHEARGESELGQAAVARVVMERVEDPRFPKDPCSVVYQRSGAGCQFSWVCTGRKKPKKHIWDAAWKIAVDVYVHQRYNNVVRGALYFNALGTKPKAKSRKVAKIGRHYFYSG